MAHSESTHLGLVAVTASGVRFYFRTATGATINQRPTTLALQHIRLPPGFTASQAAIGRPSKVHISYYNNGTYDLKAFGKVVAKNFVHRDSSKLSFKILSQERYCCHALKLNRPTNCGYSLMIVFHFKIYYQKGNQL